MFTIQTIYQYNISDEISIKDTIIQKNKKLFQIE